MSKTKSLSIALVAAVVCMASSAAVAHSSGIDRREAARLRYQYHQLQWAKRAAWADGAVTRREQARISYQQHKLRRLIHIARTN